MVRKPSRKRCNSVMVGGLAQVVDAGSQPRKLRQRLMQILHKTLGAVALATYEAVVRSERIVDALRAPVELALELVSQGGHKSAAEFFCARAKLSLGLAPLAWQQPQTDTGQNARREQPRDIGCGTAKNRYTDSSQTHSAGFE
jgi:hypothetical protein